MTTEMDFSDHIFVKKTRHIINITQSYFGSRGPDYFSFSRDFNNKTNLSFCTHEDYLKDMYTCSYNKILSLGSTYFDDNPNDVKPRFFYWDDSESKAISRIAYMYNCFNLKAGLTLQRITPNHVDYYSFAFNKNSSFSNSYYLNHFDMLLNFTDYFPHVARKLIDEAEESKVANPKTLKQTNIYKRSTHGPTMVPLYRTYLCEKYDLSHHQLDILLCLANQFTAKTVASRLHLSTKAVEYHIHQLKEKFQVYSRANLMKSIFKEPTFVSLLTHFVR